MGVVGAAGQVEQVPTAAHVSHGLLSDVLVFVADGDGGEGVHVGELRCVGDNCNQKIEFEPVTPQPTTDAVVYEYKFKSRQAFDLEEDTVVVSGAGTISSGGPKIRFSFTGVFQNNGDGTVEVVYTASTPDASFFFPAAPGSFSNLSNK